MKRVYMLAASLCVAGAVFAQTDTTISHPDTLKVGSFVIIKKSKVNITETTWKQPKKPGKTATNWFIVDLGFANIYDKTNYSSAEAQNFLKAVGTASAPTAEDFKLRAIKSSNVNIWLAMQRLSLAKGYVNLKYGVGLEMFNFRYESDISYHKSPSYVFKDSINFSKNKLYAGYVSVPFMVNINTSPGTKKGLSLSFGASAGYLIGSSNKQISSERGKVKTKGNLGLEQFRLAYIAEAGLGPIRLYGSYSMRKLHEKGLEQFPYSFGIRFSSL